MDAELNYYFGVALAQMGRLDEARARLREGYKARPGDIRFPTELAGLAFKQKNYSESAEYARRALRIDPRDTYLNDFLGTVYFLEGNTDAALKYWNRVDKPQIVDLTVDQKMRVKPALLDRAMTFSPASELQLGDLRTSKVRVEGLGIFQTHRFQLSARDDGKFDLALIAQERDGWGANTWQALLSTFRGVFYETVYPEYFNFHGAAINFTSMLRWDTEKRRATAAVSGPLRRKSEASLFVQCGPEKRELEYPRFVPRSFAITRRIESSARERRRRTHIVYEREVDLVYRHRTFASRLSKRVRGDGADAGCAVAGLSVESACAHAIRTLARS